MTSSLRFALLRTHTLHVDRPTVPARARRRMSAVVHGFTDHQHHRCAECGGQIAVTTGYCDWCN